MLREATFYFTWPDLNPVVARKIPNYVKYIKLHDSQKK